METYGARRSELQEIAAPVTKALQEVFDQIEAAIEAEKNPPPPEEGEEEGEEGEEDEYGPGGRDEDEL